MSDKKITYTFEFDTLEEYNTFIQRLKEEKLKSRKILYTFDTWEDYDNLMQYLEDRGVEWLYGLKPTVWNQFKELGCYKTSDIVLTLKNGLLSYFCNNWRSTSLHYLECRDYEEIHWKSRK